VVCWYFFPNWYAVVWLPRYLVVKVLSLLCQPRPAFSLCKRPYSTLRKCQPVCRLMAMVLNPLTVLSTLAVYKNLKTTVVQTWSAGLAWQHQSCPPWAGYGVTRSFSWALRFVCSSTRPLWCLFCYMLQKPGITFMWRNNVGGIPHEVPTPNLAHTLVSACHKRRNIRSYRLTTCYGLHQKTSFVSIRPHSSAHSGDSST